jgi:predicted transcriptional regulator
MLKDLREEHKETVERTQDLLREQRWIQRDITKQLEEESKTVPDVAEALDMPSHEVLWQITALAKYDLVEEDGMRGGYVLYKKVEE